LRMHLDLTQMPKTFQVSALANKDWNLGSEWVRWGFTPSDTVLPVTQQVPAAPTTSTTMTPLTGEGK